MFNMLMFNIFYSIITHNKCEYEKVRNMMKNFRSVWEFVVLTWGKTLLQQIIGKEFI